MARLIVICGPSGAGKGTLISHLKGLVDSPFVSISTTTRDPRDEERDGHDYDFVRRGEFLRRVDRDFFLEWAEYSGNLYGTPAGPVWEHLNAGRDVILEIDLAGARQVRERVPQAVLVFIAPPSLEELERRLRARGTDKEDAIARRMARAAEEMAELARDARREVREFDYVIVNDDVDAAADQLRADIDDIRAHDSSR